MILKRMRQIFTICSLLLIFIMCYSYGTIKKDEFVYIDEFVQFQKQLKLFTLDANSKMLQMDKSQQIIIKPLANDWNKGILEVKRLNGHDYVFKKAVFKFNKSTVISNIKEINPKDFTKGKHNKIKFKFIYTGKKHVFSNQIYLTEGKVESKLI
ncbi:hypothetical protein OAO18_07685 [Francisellaceae bacterium]|nr:hypothetical protein [Francisellaceae bacterium]